MRNTVHAALITTLLAGCGGASDDTGKVVPPTDAKPMTQGDTAAPPSPDAPDARPPATTEAGHDDARPAPGTPSFAWSPDFADFAETLVGAVSSAKTLTLTNTSEVDAADLSLKLNGSQFALGETDCSATLKAHATCKVDVTFAPTRTIQAEGFVIVKLGKVETNVMAHLTGSGKEVSADGGMSLPDADNGIYPVCTAEGGPGPFNDCGRVGFDFRQKNGLICVLCLDGQNSTQECRPPKGPGTLCVKTCVGCELP